MTHRWFRFGLVVSLLLLGLTPVQPRSALASEIAAACTYYVDNSRPAGGNGSLANPWNAISTSLSKLSPGDSLCVRGDTSGAGRVYTETDMSVDGINGQKNGTAQTPIIVQVYPGERVILRAASTDAILEFRDISYWQFDGFVLDGGGLRRYGVTFVRAHGHALRNCEVRNTREDGVNLLSSNGNTVENCTIRNVDAGPYADGTGIIINASNNTLIRGNTLYDLKGDGVQIFNGFGSASGTRIENNHFYTTLGRCSENAVDVKTGGAQPTVISGNRMHGFRPNDGACGGSGGGVGEAVILHDQAVNVVLERNEIYDSATGVTISARDVRVVNNLIRSLTRDTSVWASMGLYIHSSSRVQVWHNTLANLPDHALWLGGSVNGLELYNNLFYQAGRVKQEGSGNQFTANFNGWFSAVGRFAGARDVVGSEPGFVASGDYHLTLNSPAVDVGDGSYTVSQDFDQSPRPSGSAPDLGAFEVQGPPMVTSLRVTQGQSASGSVTVTLTWVEPGLPGRPSVIDHYELRYAGDPISTGVWDQATTLLGNVPPGQPGEWRQLTVATPFSGQGTVYFALRTFDNQGRQSAVSNPGFWPFFNFYLPAIRR